MTDIRPVRNVADLTVLSNYRLPRGRSVAAADLAHAIDATPVASRLRHSAITATLAVLDIAHIRYVDAGGLQRSHDNVPDHLSDHTPPGIGVGSRRRSAR